MVRAAQAEQRPAVGRPPGGHPGQRPAARPAGQPEQDGLGLVVQGVPEQDGGGSGTRGPPRRERHSGRSGPPPPACRPGSGRRTVTSMLRTGSSPSLASSAVTSAARSAEPSCRPWSTVTPPPRKPAGEPRRPAPRRAPASRRRRSRRPAPGRRRPGRPGRPGPRGGPPRPPRTSWLELGATRSSHCCGSANSALVGRVSGEVQTLLKVAMPAFSTTARTNREPSAYCFIFRSMPSMRRSACSIRPLRPAPAR